MENKEEYEVIQDVNTIEPYKKQTTVTAVGPEMEAFLEKVPLHAYGNLYYKAALIVKFLHNRISFTAGLYNQNAEKTVISCCGGEKDFADAAVGLCRHIGIPARVVKGTIQGNEGKHYWMEIAYFNSFKYGWFGLDPVKNIGIDERYEKEESSVDSSLL